MGKRELLFLLLLLLLQLQLLLLLLLDALSPLLSCVVLNPLSAVLDKSTYGYRFKSGNTINHLLYMNYIKLYAKNEQDIDSLIHLTQVFSSNIGMTLSTEAR